MPELGEVLSADRIIDLKSETKEGALSELVAVLAERSDCVLDKDALLRAILEREQLLSTGIGIGVAIPHAMIPEVTNWVMAVGRSHKGIDFGALDDKPVRIVVMIAASDKHSRGEYLKFLASLMQRFQNKGFRRTVMFAKTPADIFKAFLADYKDES
ncbi:MAG: PTS sugar transporter subunit IIA [Candidatus Sumerlaeia bacterium]|nr:PTS sugar transporter subunit IIA [Candidatus Sumerlaeia bacterium]